MLIHTRGGLKRFAIGLLIVAVICLAVGLLAVMPSQASGASLASIAPLNPAFLESVASPNQSSTADGRVLGGGLTLQDFSYAAGMQVPSAGGTPPATYDLRTLGKVTSVKNQNPYGTCWAFASCGSLESCLLPGETQDFSEDNMALTSGFNLPGGLYDGGGQHVMSTAY
jgi:C1A family cysteine protease